MLCNWTWHCEQIYEKDPNPFMRCNIC
jgi:hypothetical protein